MQHKPGDWVLAYPFQRAEEDGQSGKPTEKVIKKKKEEEEDFPSFRHQESWLHDSRRLRYTWVKQTPAEFG
jgi:hypothetical protein